MGGKAVMAKLMLSIRPPGMTYHRNWYDIKPRIPRSIVGRGIVWMIKPRNKLSIYTPRTYSQEAIYYYPRYLLSQIPDQARPYSIYLFHFYYLFWVYSLYLFYLFLPSPSWSISSISCVGWWMARNSFYDAQSMVGAAVLNDSSYLAER